MTNLMTPDSPNWGEQVKLLLNGQGRYPNVARTHSHVMNFSDLDGSISVGQIPDRARKIHLDLGSAHQSAGTGTRNVSTGLRITYVDAETGTWRWQVPVPSDLVNAVAGTLYWTWECAPTSGNAIWSATVGTTAAGATHSGSNVLNNAGTAFACAGTTNVQTTSSFATAALAAGNGDIAISLSRIGGSGSDTINADVQLRAVWLEYTADS